MVAVCYRSGAGLGGTGRLFLSFASAVSLWELRIEAVERTSEMHLIQGAEAKQSSCQSAQK